MSRTFVPLQNKGSSHHPRGYMELTTRVERLADGRFRAVAEEIPSIFYEGSTEEAVRGRMEQLAKALRSPHIKIDHVLPNGDVILVLDREDEEDEDGDDLPTPHISGLSFLSVLTMN